MAWVWLTTASATSWGKGVAWVSANTMRGAASASWTLTADTSHTYYVAVDGVAGAAAPYHIALSGAGGPGPSCAGGSAPTCAGGSAAARHERPGAPNPLRPRGGGAGPPRPPHPRCVSPPP